MLEEISSKFDDYRFGAVKGRSTAYKLVNNLHICHQAANHQKITRAVFVDFDNAFDRLDHHIVLNKMAALGVPPFVTRWMHSFLLDRRQRVDNINIASNWNIEYRSASRHMAWPIHLPDSYQ